VGVLTAIFGPFAAGIDARLIESMDAVIAAALVEARLAWLTALSIYVVGFALLAMWQRVDLYEVGLACARALAIAAMLQSGNYAFYVRDLFFTELPNTFGAMLGGARPTVGSAQQFDVLWSAVLNIVGRVGAVSTGWFGWADRAIAWAVALLCLVPLALIFGIWLMGRIFMAIIICLGPFLLILALWRSTRGFVEGWIGKLVGFAVFQLATSILLRILLVEISRRFQAVQAGMGATVDEMHAALALVFLTFCLGAVVMVALPGAVAIGSGSVAAAAVATVGRMSPIR
jgi:type IV secretory pathway VirB6-like protein